LPQIPLQHSAELSARTSRLQHRVKHSSSRISSRAFAVAGQGSAFFDLLRHVPIVRGFFKASMRLEGYYRSYITRLKTDEDIIAPISNSYVAHLKSDDDIITEGYSKGDIRIMPKSFFQDSKLIFEQIFYSDASLEQFLSIPTLLSFEVKKPDGTVDDTTTPVV
jgi:hypothetical protein